MKEKLKKVWGIIDEFLTRIWTWIVLFFKRIEQRKSEKCCKEAMELLVIEEEEEEDDDVIILVLPPQSKRERVNVHNHNHRVVPLIIVIIAVLWANQQGLFAEYTGIQELVNLFLDVTNEFYTFGMQIIKELIEYFNIPELWKNFQSFFWKYCKL